MDNQTRNGREFELDFDIFYLFIHRFSSYGSEMTYKVWESLPAVPGSLTGPNGSLGHLPGVTVSVQPSKKISEELFGSFKYTLLKTAKFKGCVTSDT